MADFTPSYIDGAPNSPVRPQAPVVDQSSLVTLGLIGDAVGAIGGIATNYAEISAKKAAAEQAAALQSQQDQAISAFSQSQLKLVDATEMGDISSAEARMRMRANLSRAIADNPAIATDLAKAHTSVIKSTGLGDVVYEGTEVENQQLALEREAVKAGWIKPNQSEQQKKAGAEAYVDFQRSLQLINAQSKKVSLQTAQIGLTTAGINQQSAKLRLVEQQNKLQSQQALGAASGAYSVKFGNDLEAIRQAKENGEITTEQALMMADQSWLNVSQVVTQIGAKSGSEYMNNLTKPMEMQYNNYKKYLSGETKLESLNTDNEIAVAMQTKVATGDPMMARLIATSKMFPNSNLVTMAEVNNKVVDYLNKGMTPDKKPIDVLPDFDEDKTSLNAYFGLVTDAMAKTNNGSAVDIDETRAEINTHLNSVLRGVDVYSPSVSNPGDYKSVIDFIAKPEVGRFVSLQGGFQDNEASFRAAQALQYQYDTTLIPLIQQTYERTLTSGQPDIKYVGRTEQVVVKNQKPTKDVIKPQFIGSGVTFVADPSDNSVVTRNKVKELNSTVSPILNKLIRSQAHLSGNMDYKSVWTNQYETKVFGIGEEDNSGKQ